jgi:uncharacterized protein
VINPAVAVSKEALAEFCRRHHIRWLALFGSALTDELRPDSDIDVLVEFEPGHTPGWDIVLMEDELSGVFGGRKIDLVLRSELSRWIRKRVLAEAEVLYAER